VHQQAEEPARFLIEGQQAPGHLDDHYQEKWHPQKVKVLVDFAQVVTGIDNGRLYGTLDHV
jgi:hypothetical protein